MDETAACAMVRTSHATPRPTALPGAARPPAAHDGRRPKVSQIRGPPAIFAPSRGPRRRATTAAAPYFGSAGRLFLVRRLLLPTRPMTATTHFSSLVFPSSLLRSRTTTPLTPSLRPVDAAPPAMTAAVYPARRGGSSRALLPIAAAAAAVAVVVAATVTAAAAQRVAAVTGLSRSRGVLVDAVAGGVLNSRIVGGRDVTADDAVYGGGLYVWAAREKGAGEGAAVWGAEGLAGRKGPVQEAGSGCRGGGGGRGSTRERPPRVTINGPPKRRRNHRG